MVRVGDPGEHRAYKVRDFVQRRGTLKVSNTYGRRLRTAELTRPLQLQRLFSYANGSLINTRAGNPIIPKSDKSKFRLSGTSPLRRQGSSFLRRQESNSRNLRRSMKQLLKSIQVLYSIYAILLFVALLLVIFPFVLLCAVFGKVKGGNMIYRICSAWSDIWFFLIGIQPKKIMTAGDPKPAAQYIFVANHISYLDIAMIVKTIRQPTRPLGKAEIAKVPVFGFLYRYGAIMVDRSNPENRKKSVAQLKSVLRKGISVFIFPEGTFNTTNQPLKEFYDGAFRIAIETQTPLLPVIFPDTVKRLHYGSIFSFTPGTCRAIFLEAVPVDLFTIQDLPELKRVVFAKMETALKNC